jgi:hypothetical protein
MEDSHPLILTTKTIQAVAANACRGGRHAYGSYDDCFLRLNYFIDDVVGKSFWKAPADILDRMAT